MNKTIIGVAMLIIALITISACTTSQSTQPENKENSDMQEEISEQNSQNSMQETNLVDKTEQTENILAGKTTKYLEFSQEKYEQALKDNKIIILNFYASWCPSCQAEQLEAYKAFNLLNNENVIGFRVNYKDSDTDSFEKEIAKQQGIAYQHTKIIIKDGQRVLKSPETWDSERYISEINSFV
jgi:thiol-disulfide isomerase/thioredoxin